MFAEELGGNASRKRQEENRERRRKLKQEQLKKAQKQKQQQEESKTSNGGNPNLVSSSTAVESSKPIEIKNTIGGGHDTLPSLSSLSSTKPSSAVEIANFERQQRQEIQAQKRASIKIQKFYRAYRSNSIALQEQRELLTKRLMDLSTLRNLLKKQTNTDYIPPSATSTALCRQILFLTSSIPYLSSKNNPTRQQSSPTLYKVSKYCIRCKISSTNI